MEPMLSRWLRLGSGEAKAYRIIWLAAALMLVCIPAAVKAGPEPSPYATTFDLIWGNGTKGPYSLSRQALVPGSVTVRLNGNQQLLPSDYQLDCAAGKITFTQPVSPNHIVRVDYAYDTTKSSVNVIPWGTPLSLDVAQMQMGGVVSSTLRLSSVWRAPHPGEAEMAAIGMGLDAKVGNRTQVGTLVAISPRSAQAGRAADDLDAAAVQLSGQTSVQRLQANVRYARTGAAFGAAKEYGLAQGTEALALSTTYALTQAINARSAMERTEEIGAGGVWTRRTTQFSHALTAALSPASRITVARVTQEVELPEGTARDTVVDQLQLEQRLGQAATAILRREVSVVDAGGSSQTTETTGVKLDAQVAPNTRVVAERVQKQTEQQDPAVSTQVDLSTGNKRMKLQGQYIQKEGAGLTPEQVTAARVEATPFDGLRLGGGVRQQLAGTGEQMLKDALVEVSPYSGLQLIGRLNEQADGSGTTINLVRSLDARVRPIQALEISGTYKVREQRDQEGPLTRGLRVNLSPARYFQLTGGLVQNPEEEGRVRTEERRTVGLRSDIGGITLTGNYAQRLSLTSIPLAEEFQVGLSVQLSRYDRIFSTYKLAAELGQTELSTEHYGFGYNRSIGGTFGLSLEGEYLRRLGDSIGTNDRREARAKAGLNARF